MNIRGPFKKRRLVRADSIPVGNEFVDQDGYYYVVLNMLECYFDCKMKSAVQNAYNRLWVFNISSSCLSVYEKDAMVKPIELEVIVREEA